MNVPLNFSLRPSGYEVEFHRSMNNIDGSEIFSSPYIRGWTLLPHSCVQCPYSLTIELGNVTAGILAPRYAIVCPD